MPLGGCKSFLGGCLLEWNMMSQNLHSQPSASILQVIPGFELTDSESRFATVLGISLLILQ